MSDIITSSSWPVSNLFQVFTSMGDQISTMVNEHVGSTEAHFSSHQMAIKVCCHSVIRRNVITYCISTVISLVFVYKAHPLLTRKMFGITSFDAAGLAHHIFRNYIHPPLIQILLLSLQKDQKLFVTTFDFHS